LIIWSAWRPVLFNATRNKSPSLRPWWRMPLLLGPVPATFFIRCCLLELFRNKRLGRLSSKNHGGSLSMGLQIRDDRQMKALTGLSQVQFDSLLSVFSDIYRATQQQTYEEGVASGTRRRHPGGGSKGKLPTMAEKLQFVLYYYKTYPTFDVLGQQF